MSIDLNPINQLDLVVILATMAIFTTTFFAFRKVFVLPYLEVMEARDRLLDETDARRQDARRVLGEAEKEAADALAEALAATEELRKDSSDELDAYRRRRIEEATKSASERLEQGRVRIASARERELAALKAEAAECVGLACERLLGERDPEAVDAAVEELMARRVH